MTNVYFCYFAGNGVRFTQIATLMKCEPPPSFDRKFDN